MVSRRAALESCRCFWSLGRANRAGLRQPHLTLEITQISPFLPLMTPKKPFCGLFSTFWRLTRAATLDAFWTKPKYGIALRRPGVKLIERRLNAMLAHYG